MIDGNEALVLNENGNDEGVAEKLAVTALLHRFQEVVKRYIEDEKHNGKHPLPRYAFCLMSVCKRKLKCTVQITIEVTSTINVRSKRRIYV